MWCQWFRAGHLSARQIPYPQYSALGLLKKKKTCMWADMLNSILRIHFDKHKTKLLRVCKCLLFLLILNLKVHLKNTTLFDLYNPNTKTGYCSAQYRAIFPLYILWNLHSSKVLLFLALLPTKHCFVELQYLMVYMFTYFLQENSISDLQ